MPDASDLLPAPDGLRQWMAVFSRPRSEKKVAEFCRFRGITCYLPLFNQKHRYGARVRVFSKPLFAGYVFVLASAQDRLLLQANQYVARVLTVADQICLHKQLIQIKCALESEGAVELFPHMTEGTRVMVRQGPLKGVEGLVEKFKSRTRIILSIDFIQKSVAVEVDAEWLIPV